MIQHVYVDTSVIGGLFDAEFSSDTKSLFERIEKGEIKIVDSEITNDELEDAPEKVRNYLKRLTSKQKEFVVITADAVILPDTYIAEKVVGKTSRADCMHIALATVNKVDVLVSWNFKHIVNISRIKGYNSVNLNTKHWKFELQKRFSYGDKN